jgi:hypothetical protein
MNTTLLSPTDRHRRTPLAALAVALGALVAASPGLAGDGVLEIDADCVAAGCFNGDGMGFPVEITASGSYLLTSNLVVPDASTTAVTIAADNVVLDLGGFAILGPIDCPAAFPIACAGSSANAQGVAGVGKGIVVRNGSVHGFGGVGDELTVCVSLDATGAVEDVSVNDCAGNGITLQRGTVRRAVVERTGGSGIAIVLWGVATENFVENAGASGILIGNGTVTGNTVFFAGDGGITLGNGAATSNQVSAAGSAGAAHAIGCNTCTVSYNHVDSGVGPGIRVSRGTVIGNAVAFASGFGIEATGNSVGYGGNNLDNNNAGGAQVGGTGTAHQISTNVCHGDTTCP